MRQQSSDNSAAQNSFSHDGCLPLSPRQQTYRWVIVALMSLLLLLNGLANNAIIPIEHKMTVVFELPDSYVSSSVFVSFLVFSIFNFPANQMIDSHGLRTSFLFGTVLFTIGLMLYTLVNQSYLFVIIGTVFIGAGQPFLLNCPAKVATCWFLPQNRGFTTAFMVVMNLIGIGLGFMLPTLIIEQQAEPETSKYQIFLLYGCYALVSFTLLILTFFFMKAKPTSAPYRATTAKKLSFVASFSFLFSDRNLWKFFLGYFLSYGTFISFASSSNFIIKPYGYTDFEIASNAIFLMLVGIIGSIGFSLYIKKTSNYRLIVRCLAICSSVLMIVLCTWLNTVNNKLITTGILCALGLVLSPLVPICYDLGCEISFPVGQAQVTGLLNGGAFFWAFIASSLVSFIIGYSNKNSSLLAMFILIAFIIVGSCLFVALNIVLKRKNFQAQQSNQLLQYDNKPSLGSKVINAQNEPFWIGA